MTSQPTPDRPWGDAADLLRFAEAFAGREGVHAAMWQRGGEVGYSPVHAPLTAQRVADHLAGRLTLGAYVLRADSTVTWACFDLDLDREGRARLAAGGDGAKAAWTTVRDAALHLAATLADHGLVPLVEASGFKGVHVWLLLEEPVPAAATRAWCGALLDHLGPPPAGVSIELFPKADEVGPKGLGNLVKLPLGRHLRSGRWSTFLDPRGAAVEDGLAWLREHRRNRLPRALPTHAEPFPGGTPADPDEAVPPPIVPEARPFTEADLDACRELATLRVGCPVIRDLIEEALRERVLSRDGAVVLEHTLGHLPDGVRAYNYVLDHVPGAEHLPRMVTPHSGSPSSCRRIRQRLGRWAHPRCQCDLVPRPGDYAHPLLHLDTPPPPEQDEALTTLLDALASTRVRLDRLRDELVALTTEARRQLEERPGRAARVPGGTWRLDGDGPEPAVRFHPDPEA